MEKMKFADFHIDAYSHDPRVREIEMKTEEFDTSGQLNPENLGKMDLIFASVFDDWYKMESPESKRIIEGLLGLYKTTSYFHILNGKKDESGSKANVVLHLEGSDAIKDTNDVEYLYNRGIRSLGLMYNNDNLLGGGAFGNKERGLTELGKKVISLASEKGMIVDLAHANDKTTREAIEFMEENVKNNIVVYSHGAVQTPEINDEFKGFFGDAERILSLERSLQIAKAGGLVGFTAATPFFANLGKLVDQIKRVADLHGDVSHLAIGSDFGGFPNEMAIKGLESLDKMQILADMLSENGFKDEQIRKIMGENLIKFVNKTLKIKG
jgi:membrane dipeptidase